jgi:hypothetical protein
LRCTAPCTASNQTLLSRPSSHHHFDILDLSSIIINNNNNNNINNKVPESKTKSEKSENPITALLLLLEEEEGGIGYWQTNRGFDRATQQHESATMSLRSPNSSSKYQVQVGGRPRV